MARCIRKLEHLIISEKLELGKLVESGGFANLYQANLELDGKIIKVAVKELRVPQHLERSRLEKRVLREVNVSKELDHPNIARFLGYSMPLEGSPYLVLLWYENGNVPQYLLSNPKANRPQLVLGVLKGMRYLESRGMVHGDLKPANVLVDRDGSPCLCDFGTTRFLNVTTGFTTSTQNTTGTIRFFSPERLRDDKPPTIASDVWSFGCIVIEIIARQLSYAHIRSVPLVLAIIGDEKPLDPNYDTTITPGTLFWNVIRKCWRDDANARPTIDQLIDHIRTSFPDDLRLDQATPKKGLSNRALAVPDAGSRTPSISPRLRKTSSASSLHSSRQRILLQALISDWMTKEFKAPLRSYSLSEPLSYRYPSSRQS